MPGQDDEAVRVRERQRPKQDGVDDAEHPDHRADGERERGDGGDEEAGRAAERAPGVAEVGNPLDDHGRLEDSTEEMGGRGCRGGRYSVWRGWSAPPSRRELIRSPREFLHRCRRGRGGCMARIFWQGPCSIRAEDRLVKLTVMAWYYDGTIARNDALDRPP